ncbi:MAG: DUF1837 domain-containing protein [Elusimicrobiota bacterium]|jgi:hypothetical protein
MPPHDPVDTDSLLIKTDALLRSMHFVEESFGLKPDKDHIGACIGYSDLVEMRPEFIDEMMASVSDYVYTAPRQRAMRDDFERDGRGEAAAFAMVDLKAKQKFRPWSVKGQFSELLLFNLLQHFFKAAPLLRKMPITTSPGLERNGADAFHIRNNAGKFVLYLGEAKTYKPKSSRLKSSLREAVKSILDHHEKHRSELNLYVYEEFVSEELEQIAKDYLAGKDNGIEVHLVCMVAYESGKAATGNSADEKLASVMQGLRDEAKEIKDEFFKDVPADKLPRLNYVLFPIHNVDSLIADFKKKLGV